MRYPRWGRFYESLATRFRLILFDKRGTGLSDHGGQFATLETRMEAIVCMPVGGQGRLGEEEPFTPPWAA
jgi:hypothetical protein